MLVESLYADPVVAEIHEVRRHLLEASGGDVTEFRRRLRERQKASGRKIVLGPVEKAHGTTRCNGLAGIVLIDD